MNFEEFKEQFTEDVKSQLADKGIDARVEPHTVSKLNESYEAMTVTPEGSNIGVNVNMDRFFEVMENGTDYESVVNRAVDVIEKGFDQQPEINVAALTDYVQMKEKLTDNVYHYDSQVKIFELGEKFVERQTEKESDIINIICRMYMLLQQINRMKEQPSLYTLRNEADMMCVKL